MKQIKFLLHTLATVIYTSFWWSVFMWNEFYSLLIVPLVVSTFFIFIATVVYLGSHWDDK